MGLRREKVRRRRLDAPYRSASRWDIVLAMPNYRRFLVPGATVFFTLVTHNRGRSWSIRWLVGVCGRHFIPCRHGTRSTYLPSSFCRTTSTRTGPCLNAMPIIRRDGDASRRSFPKDTWRRAARKASGRPHGSAARSEGSGSAVLGTSRSLGFTGSVPVFGFPPRATVEICLGPIG